MCVCKQPQFNNMKKQAYPGEYSKPGLIFKITTRKILDLSLSKKPNSHSNLILKDRNRKNSNKRNGDQTWKKKERGWNCKK